MRTFSLLKGLPVIVLDHGNAIGTVADICIGGEGKIHGLLIKKGAFFKHSLFLDMKNVISYGSDGIMIESEADLEEVKTHPEHTFIHQRALSGKMVLSSSGESLGLLSDVYFLEEMGTIVGYEVSDGFFSDISEGKKILHASGPPAIGKDTIIVNVKTT